MIFSQRHPQSLSSFALRGGLHGQHFHLALVVDVLSFFYDVFEKKLTAVIRISWETYLLQDSPAINRNIRYISRYRRTAFSDIASLCRHDYLETLPLGRFDGRSGPGPFGTYDQDIALHQFICDEI